MTKDGKFEVGDLYKLGRAVRLVIETDYDHDKFLTISNSPTNGTVTCWQNSDNNEFKRDHLGSISEILVAMEDKFC